jgi:hypothetical protein
MIYLTVIGLTTGGNSTVHIYNKKKIQHNTMSQNTQNGTSEYITIIILKLT